MTTPAHPPAAVSPSLTYPRKKRVPRWILGIVAIVLLAFMGKCGYAFYQGHLLANKFVGDFHQKLNNAQFEQVYEASDQDFRTAGKHDELVKFLALVHSKLGNATAESFRNIQMNANMNGTFMVAEYDTTFERGAAVETFTIRKTDGSWKLYGYHVQSNALLTN